MKRSQSILDRLFLRRDYIESRPLFSWGLLAICLAIALLINAWAWLGVILAALWQWRIWQRYYSRPWRRIHFTAMLLGQVAMAKEEQRANLHQQPFNYNRVYRELIQSLATQAGIVSKQEPQELIDKQLAWLESEQKSQYLVLDYLLRTQGIQHVDALEQILQMYAKHQFSHNYFKLRAIIAGLIEERYTLNDKAEYWFEVLNNNAP
jgi:hypothetical protein